jgi:NDP-sugar pyrophosphorylase family protein
VLCVGYLGDHIEDAIGHSQFDIEIDYSYDGPELLGTLGAIRRAVPLLGQRFLTLYGDTYLRVDFQAFDAAWRASGLPGAMTVLRNYNEWGRSNAVFSNGLITQFDKQRPTPNMEWIDYGLGGLEITTLDIAPEVTDLAVLHHRLAQQGNLLGFEASHRFYEIGTPASLEETERFLTRRRRDEAMGK